MLRFLFASLTPGRLIQSLLLACTQVASAADFDHLLHHYRHLHANPELSLQEKNTSSYLAKQLQASGYTVETGIGGYGLVAVLKNGPGKTIMFRADMDALPVKEQTRLPFSSKVIAVNSAGEQVPVMHACGHDIHMTVLLGIAESMYRNRNRWQGTLLLIAQPAEEIGAGARQMLADGLFQRFPLPDYNLAYHVGPDLAAGKIGYVSGYGMANVDSVDITVYGEGGHGAYPHKTKDPVVIASHIVLALQTIVSRELSPLEPAVVTVGSIHGGTKHNIIPNEVKLQLTVRSYADETREFLLRRIGEISRGIASTAGIPDSKLPEIITKDEYTPSVYNNPALISRILPVLQDTLGEDAVVARQPIMGGEDFGRYGRTDHQIPSVLLMLGAIDPERLAEAVAKDTVLPGLHSALFAPEAKTTIATGVMAMEATLVDLFNGKGL